MRLAGLLLLLAACGAPRSLSESDRAPLRTVAGGTRPATWVVRGTYRDGAGEGEFTDRFAADGRFAREHRSALPGGAGHDGAERWQLPIDGLARPAGGRAAREAEVTATVLSGGWPELDLRPRGTRAYDVAVDGQLVATLHLDASAGLPERLAFHRAAGSRELVFADWRAPLGFPVAHEVLLSNDRGRVADWRVREVTAEPADFAPPAAPADHRFIAAMSEVPARRVGTRLVVMARCEDSPPGFWLVDTGAGSSAVSPAIAQELGWPRVAEATLVGPSGRAARGLVRAGTLSIGAFEVDGLPVVEADVSALSESLGVPVSGVLGADVLARCVLELDFAAARVWGHDPARWHPPENATAVTLDGRVPLLEASFAPDHRGMLRLDTGSDDTVTFHGPTVRRLALTHRREDLVTVRVRGVGGEVLGDRGPHAWLEVGGQRFTHFPATYLRHSTGGLARADLAGNLGAALFDRRRLVLALPHECIVVE